MFAPEWSPNQNIGSMFGSIVVDSVCQRGVTFAAKGERMGGATRKGRMLEFRLNGNANSSLPGVLGLILDEESLTRRSKSESKFVFFVLMFG